MRSTQPGVRFALKYQINVELASKTLLKIKYACNIRWATVRWATVRWVNVRWATVRWVNVRGVNVLRPWVQVSLGIFFGGKSSQNSPEPVLIFWSSIPCVFCLYTLLKVVGYYDFSVLSMSVMGFKKKFGWGVPGGWVGGVSSIQVFSGFLEFF